VKFHRISAWVYSPNVASKRVLEKNGFCLEGVQKEAVLCEGVPTDHILYGLLKSEMIQDYKGTINDKTDEL